MNAPDQTPGPFQRARGPDDEGLSQRDSVQLGHELIVKGLLRHLEPGATGASPRRASTPVAMWDAEAADVTTTPGSTGSPERRPLASQAALAPGDGGIGSRVVVEIDHERIHRTVGSR